MLSCLVNGMHDDSGRRGHDQKLFKKRFRLDVIESLLSVIESLMIEIRYHHNV